jgi:amino acid adenylation domain-containing protein
LPYISHTHEGESEVKNKIQNDDTSSGSIAGKSLQVLIPLDYPRTTLSFVGHRISLRSKSLAQGLQAFAGPGDNAKHNAALLAGYFFFLHTYSRQSNICVSLLTGLTTASVLPLCMPGDATFETLVVKIMDLLASTPPQEIANSSCMPTAQFAFEFLQTTVSGDGDEGLVHTVRDHIVTRGFDLELRVGFSNNEVNLTLDCNHDLFDVATSEGKLHHLHQWLQAALATPSTRVVDLLRLSMKEQTRILGPLRSELDESMSAQGPLTLKNMVEASVKRTPNNVALEFHGMQMTYSKLDEHANQVARCLRKKYKVGVGSVVGMTAERSMDTMVWMLGITKAGGAYLILDLEYPDKRVMFLAEDASIVVLMCSEEHQKRFFTCLGLTCFSVHISTAMDAQQWTHSDGSTAVRTMRQGGASARPDDADGVSPEPISSDIAYVLYTSGSTGQPKGVLLPHLGPVCYVKSISEYLSVNRRDRILQQTPLTFDVHVSEVWVAWGAGATLVLCSQKERLDLNNTLAASQASLLCVTPSHCSAMVDPSKRAKWSKQLKVVVCGEAVPLSLILQWDPTTPASLGPMPEFYNAYGPTETSVYATIIRCTGASMQFPRSIGRPLRTTQLYIMGPGMNLQPEGVPGELCVGGPQLAKGYLNRAAETSRSFVPNPFSNDRSDCIYRTGDLCRWLPDKTVEFLGRIDDSQVKLRGRRIELGEIESRLNELEQVSQNVVLVKKFSSPAAILVAYAVASRPTPAKEFEELMKAHLIRHLPSHMVPAIFIILDSMPLNANGKVDKTQLPDRTIVRKGVVDPLLHVNCARKDVLRAILACFWEFQEGHHIAEILLNTRLDEVLDSLVTVFLRKKLQKIPGFDRVPPLESDLFARTALEIAALYPLDVSTVVVVVTLGGAALTSHAQGKRLSAAAYNALRSVHEQTLRPKDVWVVFEKSCDADKTALVEEVKGILPFASVRKNYRTGAKKQEGRPLARFGSINTGILTACHAPSFDSRYCWIAILDPVTSAWRPEHLEQCMEAANRFSPDACKVVAASRVPLCSRQLPGKLTNAMEEALTCGDRSALLVRGDLLPEAGLFDEAFGDEGLDGLADVDLYLRLAGVLNGETRELGRPWLAVVGGPGTVDTAEGCRPPLTSEAVRKRDAELFVYKHHSKLNPPGVRSMLHQVALPTDAFKLPSERTAQMPECEPMPLKMWDGQDVFLRRDTFDVLDAPADELPPPKLSMKMLVGVITSNAKRIYGLVQDLGCAFDSSQHCVVVFANSQDGDLPGEVQELLTGHAFRHHVICSTDRIVHDLYSKQKTIEFPLAIAQARTVLQTFLAATTDAEAFDAVAVIDDDMRLPRGWGVRDGDDQEGDVLLSRAIKTPPNPTAMSMRTQLLDLVFALDSLHAKDNTVQPPLSNNAWQCPSFDVYHDSLQDQYYDLSSARWNHLEVPRRFDYNGADKTSLIKQWRRRILVGDPFAREAVSVEHGLSLQRGGCMVLPKKSFHLLRTAQNAPTVELASGRKAASRRSDTFWVQNHHRNGNKVAIVRRHLSVLHDNTHDSIPSSLRMREVVALEMVGAILCHPVEGRKAFVQCRTGALRCSSARIRGLCKTLRGRDYFEEVPHLEAFVEDLEERFSDAKWQRDVYDVVDEHLQRLRYWEAHLQLNLQRDVPKTYCLDKRESKFLKKEYPTASELRSEGPSVPIPCLHRIHECDECDLQGAQKVQACIGMSLRLPDVEQRLRQLAKLHHTFASTRKCPDAKALVTVDDGFRDALLLRPVFRELSQFLQPVLFVPSGLLTDAGDNDNGHRRNPLRRHLPLTCLYTHCAAHDIDPEDPILGNATRSKLKMLPEAKQYEILKGANINTDCPTDDLLTLADLHELSREGWWIGTHGPDHSDLTQSAAFNTVANRLQEDVQLLAKHNWAPWFAWPEGLWCARIADALALQEDGLGVQFGLSSQPRGELDHPNVLRRVAWVGASRNKERVLITGGRGFLGQHLDMLLRAYGFDVFCFDLADGQNILDREALTAELIGNQITVVVHLAAVADLNEADKYPIRAERVNVQGTEAVLACCDACSVRLLFASTCCAYGNNGAQGVNDELATLSPTELYAETKVRAEKLVLQSKRQHDLKHVVMRLATFYGPGMRGALATAIFLKAALAGQAIRIHGTGDQTRCYTHVHDVAEGIRVILQSQFSGVVNVTDTRECSVNELAEIIMNIVGCTVKLRPEKDRVGQIQRSQMCNKRLRGLGDLGWKPKFTLETGLEQCAQLLKIKNGAHRNLGIPDTSLDRVVEVPSRVPSEMYSLASTELPTVHGNGVIWVSKVMPDQTQLAGYVEGDLTRTSVVAVRIHSECLFGDVFGSQKCDCGLQKTDFLASIGNSCPGVFVYVKGHEGRGAGLWTKTRAYDDVDQHPEKHHNDALLAAGAPAVDARTYDAAADFVLELLLQHDVASNIAKNKRPLHPQSEREGKQRVKLVLHTNNPDKVNAMRKSSARCQQTELEFICDMKTIPANRHCNPSNEKYLREKEKDNGQVGLGVVAARQRTSGENLIPSPSYNLESLPGAVRTDNRVLDGPFDPEHVLSPENVNDYLTRICVQRECDTTTGDQVGLLKAIIAGTIKHIPFQNFTLLTRVQGIGAAGAACRCPPTLGEIISDMVGGLGGLCSTINPFLFLLLKALNFQEVEFVLGTMCAKSLGTTTLHFALVARVDDHDYCVDVANGFPYLGPIALDSDADECSVVNHPFMRTKLGYKWLPDGRDVFVVKHLFHADLGNSYWNRAEWMDNYYFARSSVQFTDFCDTIEKRFNSPGNHFLKCLRFNLWDTHKGVMLRDDHASSVNGPHHHVTMPKDLWGHAAGLDLQAWCNESGFQMSDKLAQLLPEAWIQCQVGKGNIEPLEDITVTGGFFDNSANAYLGRVTVWRCCKTKHVMALTYRTIKEYAPEKWPVINKGFTGGSWFNDKLYVCWPNRVAEVDPAADWEITRHLDSCGFNDLHHVHACRNGIWVANTGMDSIDHLGWDSQLRLRTSLVAATTDDGQTDQTDVRDQAAHTARRGTDQEHVNFVTVEEEGQTGGTVNGNVTATLLQSKRIVIIPSGKDQSRQHVVQLGTSPPHEGFVSCLDQKLLRWNSTVDGHVVATDPSTGQEIHRWDLASYHGVPRGWTRGLCVLRDGFLVGSTVVRGTAENWLNQHDSSWNYDFKQSQTAVLFIPFDPDGNTRSVDVMTGRNAKIYSLLSTPENVLIKPQRFHHMRHIGFCGLDDAGDVEEAIQLTKRCPRIEWGLLCHPDKAGQSRYPSEAFVMGLVDENKLPLAIHLCGGYINNVLCGQFDFIRRLQQTTAVQRIQLNVSCANALDTDPIGVLKVFTTFPSIEWILQYNDDTAPLWTRVLDTLTLSNVSVLHDKSCGKGEYIGDFPASSHGINVGYAGGLGPETVQHACTTLDQRGVPFWIDMESAIRTNDKLDLSKCRQCLDALGM